jgi:REP element-mobilizing transposase RayT
MGGAFMDRCWFLTWTTYGTWLPGDARGFVSNVEEGPGPEVRHNVPGTPYDRDMPGLRRSAQAALKCLPINLVLEQAQPLLQQFQETARYRGWMLLVVAIMRNHVHIVVGVPGDPDPSDLLGDLKAYGSRALNKTSGKPASGTWWTESGSKRKLKSITAVTDVVQYVRDRPYPLLIWIADEAGERGALAP